MRVAKKHLNIISGQAASEEARKQKQTIAELEERLAKLEAVHSERLVLKE